MKNEKFLVNEELRISLLVKNHQNSSFFILHSSFFILHFSHISLTAPLSAELTRLA